MRILERHIPKKENEFREAGIYSWRPIYASVKYLLINLQDDNMSHEFMGKCRQMKSSCSNLCRVLNGFGDGYKDITTIASADKVLQLIDQFIEYIDSGNKWEAFKVLGLIDSRVVRLKKKLTPLGYTTRVPNWSKATYKLGYKSGRDFHDNPEKFGLNKHRLPPVKRKSAGEGNNNKEK